MPEEPEANVGQAVEHLFRQEAGKIIAALTGAFGLRYLELAEDALQEALLQALRQWSYGKFPPNPAAWLTRVAKNRALDVVRRDARFREKENEIVAAIESHPALSSAERALMPEEIRDDQLRLIFACCHPALPGEARVALTLKTLCGFGVGEIARAFLTTSETIAKRLTRARIRLRNAAIRFEIPSGPELSPRLDSVLDILYLLFNEGYNASHGGELIRGELCDEAIRLATLLAENKASATPKTHALLALFLLQAARFPARIDTAGEIFLLQDQDRSRWDQAMIAKGMSHLERAAAGNQLSAFHLQAGIASCHCLAKSYEKTDWAKILSLYDLLIQISESPVVALNRTVALAKVHGAGAGLEALDGIKNAKALRRYYLFHAVRAELSSELGRHDEAEKNYREALRLTEMPAERKFLERRALREEKLKRRGAAIDNE
jgi:RNA polymerase sigma-70 factor (ECF subfamily)